MRKLLIISSFTLAAVLSTLIVLASLLGGDSPTELVYIGNSRTTDQYTSTVYIADVELDVSLPLDTYKTSHISDLMFWQWSPDGQILTRYVSAENTLKLTNLTTGPVTELTTVFYRLQQSPLIWAPDSDKFLYLTSGNESDWMIYHVDTGESQTIDNTRGLLLSNDLQISGNGRYFYAYVNILDFENGRTIMSDSGLLFGDMEAEETEYVSSDLKAMCGDINQRIDTIYWSNNGQHMVCMQAQTDEIYMLTVNPENRTVETSLLDFDDLNVHEIQWTPDDSQLLIAADQDGQHNLYLMTLTTGEIHPLMTEPVEAFNLTWSPDGAGFSYFAETLGLVSGYSPIFYYDMETGIQTELVASADEDHSMHWSPDSERIAFVRVERRLPQVAVVGRDSGEIQPVSERPMAAMSFEGIQWRR